MFATCTLPSYGRPCLRGAEASRTYDYRRAALDALHFSKLCGRLWATCAVRRASTCSTSPSSRPEAGAPHLHATIRGAIPRDLQQVVAATDYALWWPPSTSRVRRPAARVDRPRHGYADPTPAKLLPTWQEALDRLDQDPDARPAHVMRFGKQLDLQGVIPEHADQAVRYLAKYLSKAIGETHDSDGNPAYGRHLDRLHAELRFLPCSPRCANWLRYGVQPEQAKPRSDPRAVPWAGASSQQPRRDSSGSAVSAVVGQDRGPDQT
jgi:hypothetical protein